MSEKLQRERREFTLRLSNIGTPCVRKLYLEKNFPEKKIAFSADTLMKFSFGDLTEEYLFFLAELAGHTVSLPQEEIEIAGIVGHWDRIVDGMLVDCKSASSFSFKKFKEGLTPETDGFGYLTQLGGYHSKAKEYPEVTYKTQAAFLAFDKQHGHICLDIHTFPDTDYVAKFEETTRIVNGDTLPDRAFEPEPDGYKNVKTKEFVPNGNMKLGFQCSYCDMRNACHDNIRTFLSSRGPVYMTKVVKEPKMMEITNQTEESLDEGGTDSTSD